MSRLFLFLFRYRAFLVFLLLEAFCAYFIIRYNTYQQSVVLSSSNQVVGKLMEARTGVTSYFSLSEHNKKLQEENRQLRELLMSGQNIVSKTDTIFETEKDSVAQYLFSKAEVINNTTSLLTNFITVKGGTDAGIRKGDALISDLGVVGKVTQVSQNYATAISLLHVNNHISSEILRTKTVCSTKWNGKDVGKSKVWYVPRHVEVLIGDTVVTSGYNAIFPAGLTIGVVDDIKLSPDASFYEIEIELSVDFNSLDYVYSIRNIMKAEQDSIESITLEAIQS